jgi:hypothetical protein
MPSSRGSIARMLVLSVTLTCPFAIYGSSDQGYFFGTADAGANKATDIATASATSTQIQLAQNETDLSSTGNPSTVPLKWSGLLVNTGLVRADGNKYATKCTGQFISPNVVLTAAHCVQEPTTGTWYDPGKMYFLQQYQNSDYSRAYRPICVSRFDGWFPDSDGMLQHRYQWDYAMIHVGGQSQIGHFNWEVNSLEKYHRATMTGYPAALLKGEIIQQANGSLYRDFSRQNVLALLRPDHPDLTQGTSGGAWIANFSRNEGTMYNLVVGVSSHFKSSSADVMYGPYLTADFQNLFNYVSRRCPALELTGSTSQPAAHTAQLGTQRITTLKRTGDRDLGLGRSQLLKSAEDSVPMLVAPKGL